MSHRILFAGAVAASLIAPLAAWAQGVPDGVVHGATVGDQTAGPIGAVVGGAVGGVIGGFEGALGIHPTIVASYPLEPRPAYRPTRAVYRHYRRWRRHAYRHVWRRRPAG